MENGDKVKIIDQGGNVFAVGTYMGTGIPTKDLKAKLPTLQHYAVIVDGNMMYFPVGFHTLMKA
jgi:hypothetical protein